VRRRTRLVRIPPNRASCVRLSGAHRMEVSEEWLGRRHLRTEPERIQEGLAVWRGQEGPDRGSLRTRNCTTFRP